MLLTRSEEESMRSLFLVSLLLFAACSHSAGGPLRNPPPLGGLLLALFLVYLVIDRITGRNPWTRG
jgi:hypothetical protein